MDALHTPIGFLCLKSVFIKILYKFEYFANGVTGLWTRCVCPLDFYV